jgi:hypothetical protein
MPTEVAARNFFPRLFAQTAGLNWPGSRETQ